VILVLSLKKFRKPLLQWVCQLWAITLAPVDQAVCPKLYTVYFSGKWQIMGKRLGKRLVWALEELAGAIGQLRFRGRDFSAAG
jgi:hypothetical protein